ncbi:DUF6675 family protein [Treponema zioleckii]|uniref:DUF6675 family protein n=1 Tax=Treponema zioleckii TaxID=331680 RepID=UPI0030EBE992
MNVKKLCITSIFFLILSTFCAQGESSVSQGLLESVKSSGKIQKNFNDDKKVVFSFTPNTELSKKSVKTWSSSDKPVFTSENLFYVSKDTLVKNSSNKTTCDTSLDSVSKIIRSISKMKGMQYYSNGDKKWETLYHKSNLIKSPSDKTAIPDNLSGSADGKRFYCLQKDNSFGDCFYQLDYSQRANEVSVCFTNFEPIKYGPVTAVKKGNLKINLDVIDEGDYFLVYMVVQAKYANVPFLEGRLNRSFNARVDAIYKWFTLQF